MRLVPIDTLIFGPPKPGTSYSSRQLRDKLGRMREGMARMLPDDVRLVFLQGAQLSKAQVLEAIDSELAAFQAFDHLLVDVRARRQELAARLPLLATAIEVLTRTLIAVVGQSPAKRASLGLAPGKKPRRLKPEERFAATEKLRATRRRNGTAAKKPRKR